MFNKEISQYTSSGKERLSGNDKLILDFDEIGSTDSSIIGPKGLNLALMKQSGLPIPPGFCLTTNTYDIYASFEGERDQYGLPPLLSKQIIEKYQQMDLGKVAVRSAATVEDLPKASSAGIYETEINQQTVGEILASVKKCFDSLNKPAAVDYRKKMGINKEAKMSIVIQQMVQGDVAGVMFTKHPITGERNKILINSVF